MKDEGLNLVVPPSFVTAQAGDNLEAPANGGEPEQTYSRAISALERSAGTLRLVHLRLRSGFGWPWLPPLHYRRLAVCWHPAYLSPSWSLA
jgi:hypothetical protein